LFTPCADVPPSQARDLFSLSSIGIIYSMLGIIKGIFAADIAVVLFVSAANVSTPHCCFQPSLAHPLSIN
jgi:hypothetical protein